MDSSDLYHIKQQFTLGAYKSLAGIAVPDANAPDFVPTLLYKARALIALGKAQKAKELIPTDAESLPLKAVRSLARYVNASVAGSDTKDAALEELRDLSVEVEGDDVDEKERAHVRVLAGTAFAREGEVEEALETLGAGGSSENLEATALIVQIYLSIDRVDLAKKEYGRALKWAEDDLLLQAIEASIGLVTGADAYANSFSFYSEQLANPSLSSPHLLTARGVTRLLCGEVNEARSDLEEALKSGEDEETLSASVVAAGLGVGKRDEADDVFRRLSLAYPYHPLVLDLHKKAQTFDEVASRYDVPPIAIAAA